MFKPKNPKEGDQWITTKKDARKIVRTFVRGTWVYEPSSLEGDFFEQWPIQGKLKSMRHTSSGAERTKLDILGL